MGFFENRFLSICHFREDYSAFILEMKFYRMTALSGDGEYAYTSYLSFLYICMVNTIYLLSFVETPRKFIIAELSIRKLGSSSVL